MGPQILMEDSQSAHDVIKPLVDLIVSSMGKIRRTTGDNIELGRKLLELKEAKGHGKWLSWFNSEEVDASRLRSAVGVERSARRFMQLAEYAVQHPEIVQLTPSEAYEAAGVYPVAKVKQTQNNSLQDVALHEQRIDLTPAKPGADCGTRHTNSRPSTQLHGDPDAEIDIGFFQSLMEKLKAVNFRAMNLSKPQDFEETAVTIECDPDHQTIELRRINEGVAFRVFIAPRDPELLTVHRWFRASVSGRALYRDLLTYEGTHRLRLQRNYPTTLSPAELIELIAHTYSELTQWALTVKNTHSPSSAKVLLRSLKWAKAEAKRQTKLATPRSLKRAENLNSQIAALEVSLTNGTWNMEIPAGLRFEMQRIRLHCESIRSKPAVIGDSQSVDIPIEKIAQTHIS